MITPMKCLTCVLEKCVLEKYSRLTYFVKTQIFTIAYFLYFLDFFYRLGKHGYTSVNTNGLVPNYMYVYHHLSDQVSLHHLSYVNSSSSFLAHCCALCLTTAVLYSRFTGLSLFSMVYSLALFLCKSQVSEII